MRTIVNGRMEYRRRKRELKVCSGNGVYLIYSPEEQLRYVGVAMNTFDHRIWGHDDEVSRRWTDVIPLPSDWYFFAPALEFFLIVKLQPPDNTAYRKYTIGDRGIIHGGPRANLDELSPQSHP